MTRSEKIDSIKVLAEETDTDIVSTYLSLAEGKILTHVYPFKDDMSGVTFPLAYDTLSVEVAVYMLNKRGAEGETRHSENGIDRTYADADLPPQFVRRITPKVGVL